MISRVMGTGARLFLSAVLAVTLSGGVGLAQESTNRVGVETDWSVFQGDSPKECWGVSAPKETVNTRDGQAVAVRRGDILLFVTYRPGAAGEVSFSGGYPFADGSTVGLAIGDTTFDLFTEGEFAWAGSPADDEKIIAALKNGTQAVLNGRSGRGTETKDTFSLLGFTAAIDDAAKRCAG